MSPHLLVELAGETARAPAADADVATVRRMISDPLPLSNALPAGAVYAVALADDAAGLDASVS